MTTADKVIETRSLIANLPLDGAAYRRVFREGWDARKAGQDDCPYLRGTPEWSAWTDGYDDAICN